MNRNDAPVTEPEHCPYLGLADDRKTRFSFPVQAHRCHAGAKPASIDLAYQGTYCLSSRYPTCSRYHAPAAKSTPDPKLSVEAAAAAEAEALAEATIGVPQALSSQQTASVAMAERPEPATYAPGA